MRFKFGKFIGWCFAKSIVFILELIINICVIMAGWAADLEDRVKK